MGQITLQGVRKSFGPVNIIKDAKARRNRVQAT